MPLPPLIATLSPSMSLPNAASPSAGDPPGSHLPPSCDFAEVISTIASAARSLAIKGFTAEAPAGDAFGVSFEVASPSRGLTGALTFRLDPPGDRVRWTHAVRAPRMVPQLENGHIGTTAEAHQVIDAFVSVFTTVASFIEAKHTPPVARMMSWNEMSLLLRDAG